MTSGIGDTGPAQGYSTLSVRLAVSQWGEFPLHSPSVRCHIQPSHSSACVCKCVTAGFCSLTFLHGAERQWAQLRRDRTKNPHSNPPPPVRESGEFVGSSIHRGLSLPGPDWGFPVSGTLSEASILLLCSYLGLLERGTSGIGNSFKVRELEQLRKRWVRAARLQV